MSADALLNSFAVRSFRDVADADYVAARMAHRAALLTQFMWAGQQTIEKYLKCILLLNRIRAKDVFHNLTSALSKINASGKLTVDLTEGTKKFIERLNDYGEYRYFEVPVVVFGAELKTLDRAVWEVRRYCTLEIGLSQIEYREGFAAPRTRIAGGFLEDVIDNIHHPAREPLLWQNCFFGKRIRKTVRPTFGFQFRNAPLHLDPQILDEVLKFVFLPKDVVAAYRAHAKS